jgi:hypothetical protein
LESVAETARRHGCQTRLIDLQVESCQDLFRILDDWQPDVVAFSLNYLANVSEVIDLAKSAKARLPNSFILIGGHSASFPKVFNPALQLADHKMPVKYQMKPPVRDVLHANAKALSKSLYIYQPFGRASRQLDEETERFVDASW